MADYELLDVALDLTGAQPGESVPLPPGGWIPLQVERRGNELAVVCYREKPLAGSEPGPGG